ncbi:hypothetical protein ATANTOWER_018341 [Ataeniobius toweri]|uniref:Secreted protein n=1 Tax=Ataeniobius toweri TaxID=208326 RepID=A0ABU7AYI4_9TELE|nr:hypothetical protein [Ataeniobius toweri]
MLLCVSWTPLIPGWYLLSTQTYCSNPNVRLLRTCAGEVPTLGICGTWHGFHPLLPLLLLQAQFLSGPLRREEPHHLTPQKSSKKVFF